MAYFRVPFAVLALITGPALSAEPPNNSLNPYLDLYEHITTVSSPNVRPVLNAQDTVLVHVDVALHTIVSLESTEQTLQTNTWIRMEWRDQFISWNPEDFGNASIAHVSALDIWVPDIVVYNAILRDNTLNKIKKDFSATVQNDGVVKWLYPVVMKTTCELSMVYFPVDRQQCYLDISTWTYNGWEVQVLNVSDTADIEEFVSNSEWRLVSAPVEPYSFQYTCCEEPYYGIRFHFVLDRLALFYIVNIVLPTALMLALSFVAIMLPPESDSKISMGITIFLSQVVMVLVVTEYTPVQSLSTPFLTRYMVCLLMVMTVYLMITVMVVRIRQHARTSVHTPKVISLLFLNRVMLAVFFPIRYRQHVISKRREKDKRDAILGIIKNQSPQNNGIRLVGLRKMRAHSNYGMEEDAESPRLENWRQPSSSEKRDSASQTEYKASMDVTLSNVKPICHKQEVIDLRSLSDWSLLALMFERLGNLAIIIVTVLLTVWVAVIVSCISGEDCPLWVWGLL